MARSADQRLRDFKIAPRARVGGRYRFDHAPTGVEHPGYAEHRGAIVKVIGHWEAFGIDEHGDPVPMWEVEADDGWRGYAYDDELVEPQPQHQED